MLEYFYWLLLNIMKPFNDDKLNNNFIDLSHNLLCIPFLIIIILTTLRADILSKK